MTECQYGQTHKYIWESGLKYHSRWYCTFCADIKFGDEEYIRSLEEKSRKAQPNDRE